MLAFYLNSIGVDARLYDVNTESEFVQDTYYKNMYPATYCSPNDITDDENTVLIFPEPFINSPIWFNLDTFTKYKHAQIIIWWLSSCVDTKVQVAIRYV